MVCLQRSPHGSFLKSRNHRVEAERTKRNGCSFGRIADPLQVLFYSFVPGFFEGRSEFPQVPASPTTKRYGGERAFGYLFEGRRE